MKETNNDNIKSIMDSLPEKRKAQAHYLLALMKTNSSLREYIEKNGRAADDNVDLIGMFYCIDFIITLVSVGLTIPFVDELIETGLFDLLKSRIRKEEISVSEKLKGSINNFLESEGIIRMKGEIK
jgi:hypothetical protein